MVSLQIHDARIKDVLKLAGEVAVNGRDQLKASFGWKHSPARPELNRSIFIPDPCKSKKSAY